MHAEIKKNGKLVLVMKNLNVRLGNFMEDTITN